MSVLKFIGVILLITGLATSTKFSYDRTGNLDLDLLWGELTLCGFILLILG